MNVAAKRVARRFLAGEKKMTVYRVSLDRTLDNRNAANLKGIIAFIDGECEDMALNFCLGKGAILVRHQIAVNLPFGRYQRFRGAGGGSSSEHSQAGMEKKGWGTWYSFPVGAKDKDGPGGWRHLSVGKTVKIEDIPRNFSMEGWEGQLKILERFF